MAGLDATEMAQLGALLKKLGHGTAPDEPADAPLAATVGAH
jgi:hypothetical protein